MEFTLNNIKIGKEVEGKVIKVYDDEVLIDIGYVTEGTIYKKALTLQPFESCKEIVSEGQEIKVLVKKIDDEKGIVLLSRIEIEKRKNLNDIKELFKNHETIQALAKLSVRGGLVLETNGVELFMPNSMVDINSDFEKDSLLNQVLNVKIVEIKGNKIIVSRKKIQIDEVRQLAKDELSNIKVDDVLEGEIVRIVDFGAFVKFNYNEGLIHLSELSHHKIKNVSELLSVGEKVKVKVIKVDGKKIGLSLKALQEKPWESFAKNNKVGDKITGTIVKKMQFGMLVEAEKDVVGLIHRNDYSWNPEFNFAGEVEIGNEVELKILTIDPKNKKMSLSKKHLEYNPWQDVSLKAGENTSGVVKEILEKGAIIEIQGVNAFLPISEIDVERVNKVEDFIKVNDIINVEVLNIDKRSWKMSVSIKNLVEKRNREVYEKYLNESSEKATTTLGDLLGDKLKEFK